MTTRALFLLLLGSTSVACGGAIEEPDAHGAQPAATLASSTTDAPPFGVWQLVSLDRDGPVATTVHDVLQMELRDDGRATVRRCGKTYYEPGSVSLRCGDESSYDCFYGTLEREGAAWRIRLPDLLSDGPAEQGLVRYDGDRLEVRHVVSSATAGTFVRMSDETKHDKASTSTIANCKRE